MTLLPVFDLEKSSTKDKIINILSADSNVPTKRICAILKNQYSINITYQAVHKTLKQMVDEKILLFEDKGYRINPEWVKLLHLFVERVSRHITNESAGAATKYSKVSEYLEIVELTTFKEAEQLFFKMREEYFSMVDSFPEKERIICYHAPHMQIAINSPRSEYDFMDKLQRNKTRLFALCKGDTLADKWIERFYNDKEGHPYRVKTGANCSSINEVWIYPDKLIEVFFSDKFWSLFDDLYKSIKKIDDINFAKVIRKLYTLNNEPVKVIIHRDKSIIRLAIKETLDQFSIKYEI